MVAKGKRILDKGKSVKTVRRGTLRSALLSDLKTSSGRKDIKFHGASKIASKSQVSIPIEQRAGFPLKLTKGGVHPKDWKSHCGVKIIVDLARAPWLPDDWGQGVKQTQANGRSTGTSGGILTTYVAPDGKSFFHKPTSEEYNGKGVLTSKDGWNGQVRLAKLQAQQALELARAEGLDAQRALRGSSATPKGRGLDSDDSLFRLLSPAERKCIPSKNVLHVCIVSARRATNLEGVRDIFMVQSQFEEAGVTPTWYVDEASVKEYKALGLQVVIGGKLTPSRNKALADARRLGKVCVQSSDDITAWEYRDGANAKERTDDAVNAAFAAAKRLIISPVAAARFILAKMRASEGAKPKLGGVYMLGSCSRTFAGNAFSRQHFILGDFFVVEPDSTVKFDTEMHLKEDYDFTCGHIDKYGSVMRCQRMTLNVKHYSNSGGAVANRDKKGKEEKRNVAILNRKWPGCFRANPKRKNEVIMKWKAASKFDDEDEYGEEHAALSKVATPKKGSSLKKSKAASVKKTFAKKTLNSGGLSPDAVLVRTDKRAKSSYIAARCAKASGKKVQQVLAGVSFRGEDGVSQTYALSDLRYDLQRGYLSLKRGSKMR